MNRMANPSGKLLMASPMDTIIPVFSSWLFVFLNFMLLLNFLSTNKSQPIMAMIPKIIPNITLIILLIPYSFWY